MARCSTLDALLEARRYRLLKLEAELAEPEILEGAARVIGCFDYVSADVGFERGAAGESTFAEDTNFLLGQGLSGIPCAGGHSGMEGDPACPDP